MERLERLEALEDIRHLVAMYAHYRDCLDLDKLVGLFAEDGEMDFGPMGGKTVGAAAIRAHFAESMREFSGDDPFRTMHAVSSLAIDISDPNAAVGRCFLLDYVVTDSRTDPFFLLATYDDKYIRIGGAWKFKLRLLRIVWRPREPLKGRPFDSDVATYGNR